LTHCGNQIINTWKVLKSGAGEGWRKSTGPIVRCDEVAYYIVKEERNILHTVQRRKTSWAGYIWSRNCPLKHVTEGNI
jgi:hypothetical protein